MASQKKDGGLSKIWWRLFPSRDRRGVAAIEAAFVLPAFFTLLLLMIQFGVYFILQSVLDIGVLVTGDTLRTNMAVGSSYSTPTAAALKSTIIANGGALLSASKLSVDVRQLSTLSAGAVAIADGTDDWGTSGANGSVLVLRAQMTITLVPYAAQLTITSTSIVHRPPG